MPKTYKDQKPTVEDAFKAWYPFHRAALQGIFGLEEGSGVQKDGMDNVDTIANFMTKLFVEEGLIKNGK